VGYVILESDDTLRLTAEVHRYLAEGWKPLGGVSCYYKSANQSVWYVQAMVREPAGQAEPDAAPDRGRSTAIQGTRLTSGPGR
jgi:hypothetical protein